MNIRNKEIKNIVKDRYGRIAQQSKEVNAGSCCGTSCCGAVDYTVFSDDYSNLEGYNPDADLGLGCGLPTEFAAIKKGDSVLDLGSGAGNDCFIARAITGETGKVTGVDFTDNMLEKAHQNVKKLGYENVFFVKGDIENMPIESASMDVVISNCVLNLVPDKVKAYSEIFRVLKPGGHFCISDVVITGSLPESIQKSAEMYAGCVAGAISKEEYLGIIAATGFKTLEVKKEKEVYIPLNTLVSMLSEKEIIAFKASGAGVYSITVTGIKP